MNTPQHAGSTPAKDQSTATAREPLQMIAFRWEQAAEIAFGIGYAAAIGDRSELDDATCEQIGLGAVRELRSLEDETREKFYNAIMETLRAEEQTR